MVWWGGLARGWLDSGGCMWSEGLVVAARDELRLSVKKWPENAYRQDAFLDSLRRLGSRRLVACWVVHEKWVVANALWQGN